MASQYCDDEGEVLDVLVQKRRNKAAALKLLHKLQTQGIHPETIVTDKLASYRAAARLVGLTGRHRPGGMRENNRAENSHLAIRRRTKTAEIQIAGFSSKISLNPRRDLQHLQPSPHLIRRATLRQFRAAAHRVWDEASAAA